MCCILTPESHSRHCQGNLRYWCHKFQEKTRMWCQCHCTQRRVCQNIRWHLVSKWLTCKDFSRVSRYRHFLPTRIHCKVATTSYQNFRLYEHRHLSCPRGLRTGFDFGLPHYYPSLFDVIARKWLTDDFKYSFFKPMNIFYVWTSTRK